jgi:glyoxylase-like metal-dependent hydrolase (beta-lactamase superfamily II)
MSPNAKPAAVRAGGTWREVADRVFVRRYSDFNVTIGLIVGEHDSLVVDTRGSERQGRELMDEIRWITRTPLRVVNTHHHFDHSFGNRVFVPAEIWGHER